MVSVRPGASGKPQFESRVLAVERGEPLKLEIEAFLGAIGGGPVLVSGDEGRRALALAVEINDKVRKHAERAGVPFKN
jgi:hypothetical protein